MKIPIKINYETELEISDKSFKDDVQDMLEYYLSEHEVAAQKSYYIIKSLIKLLIIYALRHERKR